MPRKLTDREKRAQISMAVNYAYPCDSFLAIIGLISVVEKTHEIRGNFALQSVLSHKVFLQEKYLTWVKGYRVCQIRKKRYIC